MPTSAQGQTGISNPAQTRLLLSLWDLNGLIQPVKRSDLNKRIVRSKEKSKDYQALIDTLDKAGAIQVFTEKRSVTIKLTEQGLDLLKTGLNDPAFKFSGSIIGTKFPNSLLRWLRENPTHHSSSTPVSTSTKTQQSKSTVSKGKISTYQDFQSSTLEVYEALNKKHNFKELVPIYRIRRELGKNVEHTQFDEWLTEMQADDIVQLMAGEMPDMTPDKRKDSLTLPSGNFRYYVKRIT
ncbi:hypothetical protein [Spirulina major]|uniref:hypothetical protein n=1 Tax=Spirulina major TaxID=270636 RepID=UPI000934591F|nr:hypothetical protein [Spirulina major]